MTLALYGRQGICCWDPAFKSSQEPWNLGNLCEENNVLKDEIKTEISLFSMDRLEGEHL